MGGGMSIESWLGERDDPGREAKLLQEVWDELAWQPGLDASNVHIGITGREVTLSGSVKSYPEKLEAEGAAKRVRGVRAVTSQLVVALSPVHEKPDRDLARAVDHALEWEVFVPIETIRATVSGGCVLLEGAVSWDHERAAAERAVSYLKGVREVSNRIKVVPPSRPADLESRVRSALRRDPELHGDRIAVKMHGGAVQVWGRVRSLAERDEAERDVHAVPGVEAVRDDLVVS